MRLLPLLLLTACTAPVSVHSNMEAQPIEPVNPHNIQRCWKGPEMTICWPIGTKPKPWQQEVIEQGGKPMLMKDDVVMPVVRQEV